MRTTPNGDSKTGWPRLRKGAFGLMETVWPAALARVEEEVADMQAIADAEGAGIEIEPWDYRYYAEKVRKAKYDLDSEEVKQYLQLDNLSEAMFFVAGEIFNFAFTPVAEGSVPVFHEDVRVWEVTDRDTGAHIGLWYLDPYARPGKRSGAWATTYRSHENIDGEITVLGSNNSNFIKGAPGEPVLISWDDATTLFHEFGHALHYSVIDRRLSDARRRRAGLHRVSVAASRALAADRRGHRQPTSFMSRPVSRCPRSSWRRSRRPRPSTRASRRPSICPVR